MKRNPPFEGFSPVSNGDAFSVDVNPETEKGESVCPTQAIETAENYNAEQTENTKHAPLMKSPCSGASGPEA